jgi:peptide/nickel transport system permease protein
MKETAATTNLADSASRAWLSNTARVALAIIALYLTLAILADVIAPRDPLKTSDASLQPPSRAYPFGTDDLGRDVLSGVIHGARISLIIGVTTALLSGLFGLLIGLMAAYFGGWLDDLLMRVTELFLAPPRFFLALVVAAIFGASALSLIVVLSLMFWPATARLVRAEVLSLRERNFIEAARALGASHWRIMRREILPHLLPLLIVTTVVRVGSVMLIEAGLEFLGLGDQDHMTWGYMLHNGQHFIRDAWWMIWFPLLAISLLLAAINLAGDELNRKLNPKSGESPF